MPSRMAREETERDPGRRDRRNGNGNSDRCIRNHAHHRKKKQNPRYPSSDGEQVAFSPSPLATSAAAAAEEEEEEAEVGPAPCPSTPLQAPCETSWEAPPPPLPPSRRQEPIEIVLDGLCGDPSPFGEAPVLRAFRSASQLCVEGIPVEAEAEAADRDCECDCECDCQDDCQDGCQDGCQDRDRDDRELELELERTFRHGWMGVGGILVVAVVLASCLLAWRAREALGANHRAIPVSPSSDISSDTDNDINNDKDIDIDGKQDEEPDRDDLPLILPPGLESLDEYYEALLETILEEVATTNRLLAGEGTSGGTSTSKSTSSPDPGPFLDPYAWTTPGTPQFEALEFVSYRDGGIPGGGGDVGYYCYSFSCQSTDTDTGSFAPPPRHLLLQRLALLALYHSTGGGYSWEETNTRGGPVPVGRPGTKTKTKTNPSPPWTAPGVDECLWEGVSCDAHFGVVGLDLSLRGLESKLPNELWAWLPYLEVLDLSGNDLKGGLPFRVLWPGRSSQNTLSPREPPQEQEQEREPFVLPFLSVLDLSGNNLEGGLPRSLSGGPPLRVLDLSGNRLGGPLPETLGAVLEEVYLGSNAFTGDLSGLLGGNGTGSSESDSDSNTETNTDTALATPLSVLDLSDNLLTGSIPWGVEAYHRLTALLLDKNHGLTGTVPGASMARGNRLLREVSISDCNLHGSAGDLLEDLLSLPYLETLALGSNRLTGTLPGGPPEQGPGNGSSNGSSNDSSNGSSNDTSNGSGSAAKPPSSLRSLALGNNDLTGTIPEGLVGAWLTSLDHLRLFGNDLEGTIPAWALWRPLEGNSNGYESANDNDKDNDDPQRIPLLSSLWLHGNPRLSGTMPCPGTLATGKSYQQQQQQQQQQHENDYDYEFDYSADCLAGGDPFFAVPPRVECPCCTRCY